MELLLLHVFTILSTTTDSESLDELQGNYLGYMLLYRYDKHAGCASIRYHSEEVQIAFVRQKKKNVDVKLYSSHGSSD
jgi:hypothetical protein